MQFPSQFFRQGDVFRSADALSYSDQDVRFTDAGFFRGSEDNPRTRIVVSEALALAKSLNMKTVAEGVEDKSTVDFLAREGCDMIQGYYFAKPMPQAEYENTVIPVSGQQVQAPVEKPAAPAEAPVAQAVPVPSVEPAPAAEPDQAETKE